MTYSDYLAAIIDPDILCGETNIDLIFHTMNPSYLSEGILKKECRAALLSDETDKEILKGFENEIDFKERSGRQLIYKDWIIKYYRDIKKVLKKKA